MLPPLSDQLAAALLCAAAFAGPLALGATGPWPRFCLEGSLAIAVSLWAGSRARDWRLLILPLAVAGLFLLQLAPLPDALLLRLAPVSVGRWKTAQEGLASSWATISVDPGATNSAIRRTLLGLATIAAVATLSQTPMFRRWFYTALAAAGLVAWGAAFAFPVNPDNRSVMGFFSLRGPIDFWKSPERGPLQTSGFCYLDWVDVGDVRYQADGPISGDGFGTYIYSNHFANALCLTLPAGWALWMLYTRNRIPFAVRYAGLLVSMALAVWTTGALAHSRAGTASLAFAAVLYLTLIAQSRWLRWMAGGVAAAGAISLAGFVAAVQGPFSGLLAILPAALNERMAPLLSDARIVAARVAGRMFLASPILGTGLGTYGDLYAVLQRSDYTMYFAHNDYAQFLAEAGLLGAVILGLAAWALGWRLWRFCSERPAANRLIDAGAWAALAGAGAHSFFDWNMHAPANLLLACIVAGLAVSSVAPSVDRKQAIQPARWNVAIRYATVFACLGMIPLLCRDAFTADTLDELRRANTAARVQAKKPDAASAKLLLEAAIDRGERAIEIDPGNWQLAAMLGQANLHLAVADQPNAEAEALRLAAEQWFATARRNSAATRGLPMPASSK
jgi:hypothetical protein